MGQVAGGLAALVVSPEAWIALVTLIVMEVVLGVDNLVFVALLSNKLPEATRGRARRIGIGLALVLRLVLLSAIAFIVGLTRPVLVLPFAVPSLADGHPMVDLSFSWRDLILLAGGLFLVWKATSEIHHSVDPEETAGLLDKKGRAALSFGAAIVQILALDVVFSIDSILTAVGMTEHLPIMMAAVVVAVALMLVAAGPLARFIHDNPSVVMLALGFLLMIGATLIAEGFGVHVPKGYIYAAMAFSGVVEGLNMLSRRKRRDGKPPADKGPTLH
ncbi:MAG TPA: TerC family protein [Phenylobacterium sp.]|jgi:predicted tellurium resistance membrane protein TerC|uniref:TerC family protein n=1 Tax=Phenylobacterium sp. TaxID=1871053 RepID=UPI002BBE406A|nr:TerC family protein [Phenylobacterium sp.]HXA39388.1 TerC family protein [Phenylobacterium sp.]